MAAIDFTSGYVQPKLEIASNGTSFTLRLLTMNCWLVVLSHDRAHDKSLVIKVSDPLI